MEGISAEIPFTLSYLKILDGSMAYIDTRPTTFLQSDPVVLFLHGNPTSSYLWRNIIPHVATSHRCIAPDLIGMGASSKPLNCTYHFEDHVSYLDAFLASLLPSTQPLILVVQDWGSALGLHFARRHTSRIAGLALMEFIFPVPDWSFFSTPEAKFFKAVRGPKGREMIIENNFFIEHVLPSGVVRGLTEAEMQHYRAPYLEPTSREPTYRWPNEIPIAGQPADVAMIVDAYHEWLLETELPKIFFWARPGTVINESRAGDYAKKLKNTKTVFLGEGKHNLQEDHPHVIGKEIAGWIGEAVKVKFKSQT